MVLFKAGCLAFACRVEKAIIRGTMPSASEPVRNAFSSMFHNLTGGARTGHSDAEHAFFLALLQVAQRIQDHPTGEEAVASKINQLQNAVQAGESAPIVCTTCPAWPSNKLHKQ